MSKLILIKPSKFEDTKRIVKHIVEDSIVHLDLEMVDPRTYQRIIDFVSGAVYLKDATLLNPTERQYISVPKDMEYKVENNNGTNRGKGSVVDLRYNEEEEIRPMF